MQQTFPAALTLVLKSEGGYSDDPRDAGGATNFGITQATYDAWQLLQRRISHSVKTITQDEVAAIYRRQYWDAIRGDDLPKGIDLCVFDEAVNSGPMQAAKDLQRSLPGIVADGHIGIKTLAAANGANLPATINKLCDRRLAFLRRLAAFATFGKGWTARVERVRAAALRLV